MACCAAVVKAGQSACMDTLLCKHGQAVELLCRVLSGVEAAESHASLSSTEPDNDFVLAVMRAFLTPRPPQLQVRVPLPACSC